jgi:hypothetical protein
MIMPAGRGGRRVSVRDPAEPLAAPGLVSVITPRHPLRVRDHGRELDRGASGGVAGGLRCSLIMLAARSGKIERMACA